MWIIQYYEDKEWHCYDEGHSSFDNHLEALKLLKELRRDYSTEFTYRLLECKPLNE